MDLPRYRSHKVVQAAKITGFEHDGTVHVMLEGHISVPVTADWMVRHKPQVGGYYVVYDNGAYASYSPADVFEEGYTRLGDADPTAIG